MKSNPARRSELTKASLNCQKVGFTRSLTEEGRTARRVQAVLKHNTNDRISMKTERSTA